MNEMVERVAMAIAEKIHLETISFNLREIGQEGNLQSYLAMYPAKVTDGERALARAAIEAMREPSATMLRSASVSEHAHFYPDKGMAEHTWRSTPMMLVAKIYRGMIDAALKSDTSAPREPVSSSAAKS